MGGMVQSNGAVQTLKFTFGVPAAVGTLAVGGLTVAVLAGGNERIMRVTERLIPLASTVYVVCAGVVILTSYERIPMVLAEVFRYALLPRSVAGGVGGYGIRQQSGMESPEACFPMKQDWEVWPGFMGRRKRRNIWQ